MKYITLVVEFINNAGASSILPILITVLGLYFGMGFWQAFRNGLMIGIGFIGINTILGVMMGGISGITAYYNDLGEGFTVLDIGWQGMAAAAWSTPFAVLVVPVGFIVNFILVKAKVTKTINVDLWNYWHLMNSASFLYYTLKLLNVNDVVALVIGAVLGIGLSVAVCIAGDITGDSWGEYFDVQGTCCTTSSTTLTQYPFGRLVNWIIEKIPGLNKIDINIDAVQEKLGPIGDTSVMAFLIGILLSVMTKQSLASTLSTSITLAASLIIMPRMISMLMEGLNPIGQAAQEKMQKELGDDYEIFIGMDIALGLGDTVAMQTALVMIPIGVVLTLIIPGVTFFPIAGLAGEIYSTANFAWACRGNVFRTLLVATLYFAIDMYVMSFIAPYVSRIVQASGVKIDGWDGKQAVVGSCADEFLNLAICLVAKACGLF